LSTNLTKNTNDAEPAALSAGPFVFFVSFVDKNFLPLAR